MAARMKPEETRRGTFVPFSLCLSHLVVPLQRLLCFWAPFTTEMNVQTVSGMQLALSHFRRRSRQESAEGGLGGWNGWGPCTCARTRLWLRCLSCYLTQVQSSGPLSSRQPLSISCSLTRGERSSAKAEARGRMLRAFKNTWTAATLFYSSVSPWCLTHWSQGSLRTWSDDNSCTQLITGREVWIGARSPSRLPNCHCKMDRGSRKDEKW